MIPTEQLEALIARRETSRVDLKLELNLDTPWHKAEFVKDLMAFANGHEPETAYILIGVRDDGEVIGLQAPLHDEARLQQIAADYTDPPVDFSFYPCILGGVTIGVIEIPVSSERFHVARSDIQQSGGKHLLREGETVIRQGTMRRPLAAIDFRRLKEDLLRNAIPEPDLIVTFGAGQLTRQTTRNGWNNPEDVLREISIAHARDAQLHEWLHKLVPVWLFIENKGTQPADGIVVDVTFPEECRLIASTVQQDGWSISLDSAHRRVCLQGADLMHNSEVNPGVIYVRFLRTDKTYTADWAASARNMRRRTSGLLTTEILPQST